MQIGLTVANQNKKKQTHHILHYENAIYRVLHERSNITAPSAEHPKFPEKMTFAELFWVKRGKEKEK